MKSFTAPLDRQSDLDVEDRIAEAESVEAEQAAERARAAAAIRASVERSDWRV